MNFALWFVFLLLLNCKVESWTYKNSYNVQTFDKGFSQATTRRVSANKPQYSIDDIEGVGRTFDGIGGLSGGGATSRLLVNYQEPYRSQILDYLFKPGFGASLHILKVEIGGDAQSTEGTEQSHMRSANDENYTRGYEWWLMKEAKSRNPNIKLIGLPWGWPSWIGQGSVWPYENKSLAATYVTKWIQGAKLHHNLTIDYVGIWNERPYDAEYIKVLRKTLDAFGFNHVAIIADDNSFIFISESILRDDDLAKAVEVIGAHYPGTSSTSEAIKTGKQLWSSEDYSTFNDPVGAGCWARILNQNHVNGNMSATIAWNLIASYYDALPFNRSSLMTANEPWSGHYELTSPLWVTAHTTQFTQPGWKYLHTVGHLEQGGSYVSLTDGKGNLTIVIETMTHNQSICIRPYLEPYTVKNQTATFQLDGSFKGSITKLNLWKTQLGPLFNNDLVFHQQDEISVNKEGQFTLFLPTDVVVTLSTITTASKGNYPTPPPSKPFPIPYVETFEPVAFSEAFNFADQAGAFETFHNASSEDGHEWTLRQVVTSRPITWCDDPAPITVIGDYSWSTINASVSLKLEGTDGGFLAIRMDRGGCDSRQAEGLFFWLMNTGSWFVTEDLVRKKEFKRCHIDWKCYNSQFFPHNWNKINVIIGKDGKASIYLNGSKVWQKVLKEGDVPSNGWVAIGTKEFGLAQFDDFIVEPVSSVSDNL